MKRTLGVLLAGLLTSCTSISESIPPFQEYARKSEKTEKSIGSKPTLPIRRIGYTKDVSKYEYQSLNRLPKDPFRKRHRICFTSRIPREYDPGNPGREQRVLVKKYGKALWRYLVNKDFPMAKSVEGFNAKAKEHLNSPLRSLLPGLKLDLDLEFSPKGLELKLSESRGSLKWGLKVKPEGKYCAFFDLDF